VLLEYRQHGENVGSRYRLDYSSVAALQRACRALRKNEVAQVRELRRIQTYLRKRPSHAAAMEPVWQRLDRIARRRAKLVTAIADHGRLSWVAPALRALGYPSLRPFAWRALTLSALPGAFSLGRRLRRPGAEPVPASARAASRT
jgi:hypothetical protein